jgi:aarF domain-containing kinase
LATDIAGVIFPDFRYGWLPHEFKTRLPQELDFNKEAANAEKCKAIFKDHDPRVYVPKVYREFTRERVLTMSFEEGIPVSHVKEMHAKGINLKKLSSLISETFVYMIYEKGFVHSDPHPGNMFVRKRKGAKSGDDIELVILDHGIYTTLPIETRLSYSKLWRGILSQDERMIRESSKELGADFYELFAAIIVNRTYDDIMKKDRVAATKSRLGESRNAEEKDAIKHYALYYHKDIVHILDVIKRELLLVLKTNNYLKSIDSRLGNPNNSFTVINDVSWHVFSKELRQRVTGKVYWTEFYRYYRLKFLLFFYRLYIRVKQAFGYKASEDELQDFELESH